MPDVLLLHSQGQYATALADAIRDLDSAYDVDVVVDAPVRDRVRHLASTEYDVVQADECMVNGVLAAGKRLLSDARLVVTIRGWADYCNSHGQYGAVRDASIRLRTAGVLRATDRVLFVSEISREKLGERYAVGPSDVVGRPIDVSAFRDADRTRTDGFDVVTVTNFRYAEKRDGVLTVLDGLEPLFDRYDSLRYAVAGGGRHLNDVREFLDSYPHRDRVDLLGYREDVPNVLAGADLFAYVSYLDAYPTVVLEAQAAGLPVVGGDAVGVPEVVGDGGHVCPATSEGVAAAVERVLTDAEFREALADRSVEKMRTYNEDCARRHVAAWDAALGRESSGERRRRPLRGSAGARDSP